MDVTETCLHTYVGSPYCLAEMYAGRVTCCPWQVALSRKRQDKRTDGQTPDRYITLIARRESRDQCNKGDSSNHEVSHISSFLSSWRNFYCRQCCSE